MPIQKRRNPLRHQGVWPKSIGFDYENFSLDPNVPSGLARSLSQGELSPLEIGMHALHCVGLSEGGRGKKGGLSEYAGKVGRSGGFITQIVNAAKVVEGIKPFSQLKGLESKTQHLYEIHALPESCWQAAVKAMLKGAWSAKETGKQSVHSLWTNR